MSVLCYSIYNYERRINFITNLVIEKDYKLFSHINYYLQVIINSNNNSLLIPLETYNLIIYNITSTLATLCEILVSSNYENKSLYLEEFYDINTKLTLNNIIKLFDYLNIKIFNTSIISNCNSKYDSKIYFQSDCNKNMSQFNSLKDIIEENLKYVYFLIVGKIYDIKGFDDVFNYILYSCVHEFILNIKLLFNKRYNFGYNEDININNNLRCPKEYENIEYYCNMINNKLYGQEIDFNDILM